MFISCLLHIVEQLDLHIFVEQLILIGSHFVVSSSYHVTINSHRFSFLVVSSSYRGTRKSRLICVSRRRRYGGALWLSPVAPCVSVYCSNRSLSGLCMSGYVIILKERDT